MTMPILCRAGDLVVPRSPVLAAHNVVVGQTHTIRIGKRGIYDYTEAHATPNDSVRLTRFTYADDGTELGAHVYVPMHQAVTLHPVPVRDAELANQARALADFIARTEAWAKRTEPTPPCPYCQQPIERVQQVGRCVYARPCNHRLWQGGVPAVWADAADEPIDDWMLDL